MRIQYPLTDKPDGNPISGQTVTLHLVSDDTELDSTTTDADGVFTFDLDFNPGPTYYQTTIGGVTLRHSTQAIMPVDTLDLSAIAPFQTIWTNGVNPTYEDALVVATGFGLSYAVGRGAAIIDGHPFALDVAQLDSIPTAHASLPRIDLIYLAFYSSAATEPGMWEIGYLAGTPAASPVTPTPTVTDGSYIPLASVRVDAGVTSIASGKVTDLREFTTPTGTGIVLEVDDVSKGTVTGIDLKSPLYGTYVSASLPADVGIHRGMVTPVQDASVDNTPVALSTTTETLLDSCTLPALRNGQSFRIVCEGFVTAEGSTALADGQIGIRVDGGTTAYSGTVRWEHGVDAPNLTYHKETKTGTGAEVVVDLYLKRTSGGTLSAKWYGIKALATPNFTAGT